MEAGMDLEFEKEEQKPFTGWDFSYLDGTG